MALSPKENFDPPRSGITPNISYADAVVNKKFLSTTKRSLLIEQQPISASGTSSSGDITAITSRVLKDSLYKNGYFLEISKIKDLTDYHHLTIVHQLYGSENFHGVKFFGKPSQRVLELYPKDEIKNKFTNEEILYDKLNIRLLPCKALEGKGKVVQVKLSDIPLI
ncbi:hypothetical protein BD770DRAFT_450215 [Pilaira anomala]|nr:hypothetical protein BD770DRAFT_450215 [Pilaira anomala]